MRAHGRGAYLEVLRASEPPEVVWSGVSGQISRLDAAAFQRDRKLRAEVSEVRAQVAGVEGTVAEVSAKVAGVEGKVDALDQKLLAELAEVKALLAGLGGREAGA